MRNLYRWSLAGCAMTLLASSIAQAALFNWNEATWTEGGLTGTFHNVDGTGLTVTVSLEVLGGATFNENYPRLNLNPIDGGMGDILQLDMASMGANSPYDGVQISVAFSQAVSDVNFQIFDIDRGTFDGTGYSFVDTVGDFQTNLVGGGTGVPEDSPYMGASGQSPFELGPGVSYDAYPDPLLNGEPVIYYFYDSDNEKTYYFGGSPLSSSGFGDEVGNNATTSEGQRGTLHVDLGSSKITGFSFTYTSYLPGSEGTLQDILTSQAIALSHIEFEFTPVPEAGTVAGIAAFLLGALGLEYRRRRVQTVSDAPAEG